MKFVIDGLFYHRGKKGSGTRKQSRNNRTFPGLNDFIDTASKNPKYRNAMKREYQNIASTFIRQQATHHIEGQVFMFYYFYERDKRRDPSNIASFFIKVFEDALQECDVIDNDNWNIAGYSCYFMVDKENPRVEIEVVERSEINNEESDDSDEDSDEEDDGEETDEEDDG